MSNNAHQKQKTQEENYDEAIHDQYGGGSGNLRDQ